MSSPLPQWSAEVRAWIRDVGFPAIVALFVLVRLEASIEKLAKDTQTTNTALQQILILLQTRTLPLQQTPAGTLPPVPHNMALGPTPTTRPTPPPTVYPHPRLPRSLQARAQADTQSHPQPPAPPRGRGYRGRPPPTVA